MGFKAMDSPGARSKSGYWPSLACALALAAYVPGAGALADDTPAERGARNAGTFCSPCHAVARTGASPNPAAPPFRTLISRLGVDGIEDVLLEELALGHPPMPAWQFSPEQADDLLSYMQSLEHVPPKLK